MPAGGTVRPTATLPFSIPGNVELGVLAEPLFVDLLELAGGPHVHEGDVDEVAEVGVVFRDAQAVGLGEMYSPTMA
jgi:hypothetical protein